MKWIWLWADYEIFETEKKNQPGFSTSQATKQFMTLKIKWEKVMSSVAHAAL